MVPRYSRPEMTAIWSPENRYRIWFAIEVFAAEAMGKVGMIPAQDAATIRAAYDSDVLGVIDVEAIDEIEAVTKHDVIDTALAVQLKQAADLLVENLDALLAALKRRAFEHKLTPTIGRSHGIHAEPTSFGLKLAQAYAEFDRNRSRLIAARDEIATAAISGAVGTFANVRPEAEEYFSPGQKGSSAMPHKRNPVLTENLTGLARVVRGAVIPAMENVALWHERDISHSSVERFIGPDATITLDFALARLTSVVEKLLVYPERMEKNLNRMGGLIHSQRVLLALTQAGLSREDSYALVQRNAMKVWESDGQLSLLDLLKNDPEVSAHLGAEQLESLFNLDYHLREVDTIFERVFGN